MNHPFVNAFLGIALVATLLLIGCTNFRVDDYDLEAIMARPDRELETMADTTRTLARLAALSNPRKRVDSLIYYAEWLKNYDENTSLFYAQRAYNLATEKNWTVPRAVSANRIAHLKGKRAKYGEDIEDAMVDARISRRLLEPYDYPYWRVDIDNLFGFLFKRGGQIDSARYYFEKALKQVDQLDAGKEVDNRLKGMVLLNLGTTYFKRDSQKTAYYYEQSDSLFQLLSEKEPLARLWLDWAIFYQFYQAFEKADSFLDRCLEYGHQYSNFDLLAKAYQEKGFVYSQQFALFERAADFNSALENLNKCLQYDLDYHYRTYEILGNVFQDSWAIDIDESHADSAIYYYKKAMNIAREAGAIKQMKYLSTNIAYLTNYAGGLHQAALGEGIESYLDRNYAAVVDTITNHTVAAYQRINSVEQRDIKFSAARKRRNQLWISLGSLFLIGVGFIVALQRQQNRRLKAETRALRAQIDPHFVSNSLNAIESLVNQGRNQEAAKYLVRFSRLARQILSGSRAITVSLSDELKTLSHFLALEQLRIGEKLTFDMQVDPTIDADRVTVPAMILQPYVENAIWHGIKPKEEGGHVQISASKEDDLLVCSVEDNGIGREQSKKLQQGAPVKHKSVGMAITEERLKATGRIRGARVIVQDLTDATGQASGTKVIIRIPYRTNKHDDQ